MLRWKSHLEELVWRHQVEVVSVIISNRGGLPETITNGIILKRLNYQELYRSIEQLIKNKQKNKNYKNYL